MVMPYYLSEYPHQILPLPQAVEELKQKGKKKGKEERESSSPSSGITGTFSLSSCQSFSRT
ncbi:hypothetical protein [Bacteroides uniformis]|uniref:hypothetical protein n=1 Tax=Bacteroides uniformis TaxID=820 RepID=UPI0039B6BF6A